VPDVPVPAPAPAPVAAAPPKKRKPAAPAAAAEPAVRKKREKKKKPKDKNRMTKTQARKFRAIKDILEGKVSTYKIARSVFKKQFMLRFEGERQRHAKDNNLGAPFPIKLGKGVLRRTQLALDQRIVKIAVISARALDEFGLKKCSLSLLEMARDIYDMCLRNGSVRLSWFDRVNAAYNAKLLKQIETRRNKKRAVK
jgi:hypothetical protein